MSVLVLCVPTPLANLMCGCLTQLSLVSVAVVAAFFQGPRGSSEQQRVQPMRQANFLRIPIVDSDIEHQLAFPLGSRSSSSGNNSNSSSSSSDSHVNDDCDDEDVYMSGGSTVSAGGSNSSSSDNPKPQPQRKNHRCVAAHSPADQVVDVDAMSSDGCPVHMLSKGEYSI